jgi:hypothetical protein
MYHLFGSTSFVGQAFIDAAALVESPSPVFAYSRSSQTESQSGRSSYHYVDFDDPTSFFPAGESCKPSLWVCFAPIWLFAPFFERIAANYPDRVAGLRGVIACSSSSVITKRFAVNRYDRELVSRLDNAERLLLVTTSTFHVPCVILQPTLIYGRVRNYRDSNLFHLLHFLRNSPFFPLPAQAGTRQPIHCTQLAAVALSLAEQIVSSGSFQSWPQRIALGGDTILSYSEMVNALKHSQPSSDPAHRCRSLPIPNRLFFLLAAPLLLRSPKAFETVLRMGANLSGFTPVHQLLGCEPQPFPVLPLA